MSRLPLPALIGFFLVFLALSACADSNVPAVERQDLAVTLVPQEHLLIGLSSIQFAPGAGRVFLRLAPAAEITSVSLGGQALPYSFRQGTLSFKVPEAERRPVTVSYRVKFNDPVSQHPASSEDPTYGVDAAITPQGTFLGSGSGWYPITAALPRHRSLRIEAPAGTEAISAGKRMARETKGGVSRSLWEEEHPVGELSLSAGNYRIEERRVDGIDLYTYFYPDNAALAQTYLLAAAKYISFYSNLFGPYPFEKFAVVENYFPTGYGLPSYTLLGSTVIRLPFIIDTSFPHEIAHSWWGNGVEPDPSEGNWSEGLVTYLADYLLKEKRSPDEGRDYRRQILSDYASLVAPERDFPLTRFTSRVDPSSRTIGYGKSAMVFHMVRKEIGDAAFFEGLKTLARTHLYQSATWSDFQRAFSAAAGRDLRPFMQQWLSRAGGPRLTLSQVSRNRVKDRWVVTGTLIQQGPAYDVSVPLRLETSAGAVNQVVTANRERTPFRIETTSEPKRLLLDPEVELFRILEASEIPVTVNSIKGSEKVLGVRTKSCQATPKGFQDLLASLGHEKVRVIGEEQLDPAQAMENDLVFCGVPADSKLLGVLPAGVTLTDRQIAIAQENVRAPDALLFMLMQRPGSQRVIALYHPLSERAAEQYSYKITHYGKYGYLLFTGGANRLKGSFPPPAGGSTVQF